MRCRLARALGLVGWLWLTGYLCAQPADSVQPLVAVANGYRANLESFEFISCRYTITWGYTTSLDQAIAGQLQTAGRVAKVEFYKDRSAFRFRLEEDAATKKELDAPVGKGEKLGGLTTGPLVPFMTGDFVRNDERSLLHIERDRTANIYTGGNHKTHAIGIDFILAPLGDGEPDDFGLLIDRAARGEVRFTAGAVTGGEHTVTFHPKSDTTVSYTIDLARGFLPKRVEHTYENGQAVSQAVVTQVRKCSRDRWFPERVVLFSQPVVGQRGRVMDFKVTALDVDNRPSKDDLRVSIPAGTNIRRFEESGKSFRTRQPERVSSDDLDRIYQLTEKVPEEPLTDTAIAIPPSRAWIWYAGGGCVLALLVATYFGRRYLARRGSNATP